MLLAHGHFSHCHADQQIHKPKTDISLKGVKKKSEIADLELTKNSKLLCSLSVCSTSPCSSVHCYKIIQYLLHVKFWTSSLDTFRLWQINIPIDAIRAYSFIILKQFYVSINLDWPSDARLDYMYLELSCKRKTIITPTNMEIGCKQQGLTWGDRWTY